MKAPRAVQQAAYVSGTLRTGRLRVALNGDAWEGSLRYKGAELDTMRTVRCNNPSLGRVLESEAGDCFALPLFAESDTAIDLTERWVSPDFEEGGRVITEDVNFDGHADLVLLNAVESSLSQRSYHIWLYDAGRKDYYYWDLPARTGGELLARDRQHRELLVGTADSETKSFKVTGDTTLQRVASSREL
ncbi:hypothetical protein [Flaviaesturariibacter terrae]